MPLLDLDMPLDDAVGMHLNELGGGRNRLGGPVEIGATEQRQERRCGGNEAE